MYLYYKNLEKKKSITIQLLSMKPISTCTAEEVQDVPNVEKELLLRFRTVRDQIFILWPDFYNNVRVLVIQKRLLQEGRFPCYFETLSKSNDK